MFIHKGHLFKSVERYALGFQEKSYHLFDVINWEIFQGELGKKESSFT